MLFILMLRLPFYLSIYWILFPLLTLQPRRRSFSRASYRKAEDRREICDRVYGHRVHSFPPNI